MLRLTNKGIALTKQINQKIESRLAKIQQRLQHFYPIRVNLLLKKTTDKYHPRKHYHASFGSYLQKKITQSGYQAALTLKLPHKNLRVHTMAQTVDDCIKQGADLIEKQLQKYKQTHFKSDSAYPDHQSIRKDEGL